MIEVKNLTKKYGKNTAVRDLSFSMEEGRIYGFLGPNGAGKSTTMNIMTGYIAPSSGQVLINGHDIVEEGQLARKDIGYLPEVPPVYPEMTVEEYLVFSAELKKTAQREQKQMLEKVMEETGVTQVRIRMIRNLSKGFRQRVGLAQALIGDPKILILDEPMVGLDPRQIIEIRELIRNLGKTHTVILSSHILSEISEICDHILIISRGTLVAQDTPENLQRMMKDSASLELTALGGMDTVVGILDKVSRIREREITKSADAGALDISLKTDGDADIRAELFTVFSRGGVPLLRMQQKQVSLEDIFLELTADPEHEGEEDKEPFGFFTHFPGRSKGRKAGKNSLGIVTGDTRDAMDAEDTLDKKEAVDAKEEKYARGMKDTTDAMVAENAKAVQDMKEGGTEE